MKKTAEKAGPVAVDLGPMKWETAVRIYMAVLENPKASGAGKEEAGAEILRMARAMDERNAGAGRAVLTAEGGRYFLRIAGGAPVEIVTPKDWTDSVRAGFCPAKARDIAGALGLELVEG